MQKYGHSNEEILLCGSLVGCFGGIDDIQVSNFKFIVLEFLFMYHTPQSWWVMQRPWIIGWGYIYIYISRRCDRHVSIMLYSQEDKSEYTLLLAKLSFRGGYPYIKRKYEFETHLRAYHCRNVPKGIESLLAATNHSKLCPHYNHP